MGVELIPKRPAPASVMALHDEVDEENQMPKRPAPASVMDKRTEERNYGIS